jgi:hypothetical protein
MFFSHPAIQNIRSYLLKLLQYIQNLLSKEMRPNFFTESSGVPSMGRLMSFTCLVGMFVFGGIACFVPSARDAAMTMVFACGGKSSIDKGVGKIGETLKP